MTVTIRELVDGVSGLEVVAGDDFMDRLISVADVSRPSIEMTGYFNFYPADRVQIFGRTEISFAERMTPDERKIIMKKMCTPETPCFVITRNLTPPEELIEVATEKGIPVLVANKATTRLVSNMTNFLESNLADRRSQHGVLIDIYGMGVLIIGDSGIGKSETALELVKRGHRLVADDRVDLFVLDDSRIIGEPPEILRNLIEIRGLGVIDVVNLFGVGAVRASKTVNLVINLEHWDKNREYDRLGNNVESFKIFNVDLPKISIPVRVGRNLAIIIELAAMNRRAKDMGHDSTQTFEDNLARLIQQNTLTDSKEKE
ncbi:HPr(Ser) kinase/phosphatase [Dolosigranulum savutiense]|uniref:HPr kinase/phosphorylase n=1 Tax=Dolosigranulum savutiense TaxID=3110288 RepID=A0AB74TXF8_9LACT